MTFSRRNGAVVADHAVKDDLGLTAHIEATSEETTPAKAPLQSGFVGAYRVRLDNPLRSRNWGVDGFTDTEAADNRARITALQAAESGSTPKRDAFTLALKVLSDE